MRDGLTDPTKNDAVAQLVANQNVSTVIIGATRVDQVRENMKALEVLPKLTLDVLSRIDAVVKPCVDRD